MAEVKVKSFYFSTEFWTEPEIQIMSDGTEGARKVVEFIDLIVKAAETNKKGIINKKNLHRLSEDTKEELKYYQMITETDEEIQITKPERWYKVDRTCVIEAGNWDQLRNYIIERDKWTCQYCGDKKGPFEADHVIPRKKGGLDTEENLKCACISCNRSKGSKDLEEWMEWRKQHGEI
jgi:5-methylcytosine-specific restriction endonuclease McrA